MIIISYLKPFKCINYQSPSWQGSEHSDCILCRVVWPPLHPQICVQSMTKMFPMVKLQFWSLVEYGVTPFIGITPWSTRTLSTVWNDKIVALEKTKWFHFCLMKTVFFFVADHLLVGQLCTNPESDRSLLSCLKVTQCSTSKIGEAPLYNSCSLPIQVMTIGPLPAPSKLPWITGMCQGDENNVSGYGYGLWCGFKWGPHHATSHLRSRLESQH